VVLSNTYLEKIRDYFLRKHVFLYNGTFDRSVKTGIYREYKTSQDFTLSFKKTMSLEETESRLLYL